jgi:hypothetical protein
MSDLWGHCYPGGSGLLHLEQAPNTEVSKISPIMYRT